MNFKHLGYDDGKSHAKEDIDFFGVSKAKEIAKQLESNDGFSAIYKTGYANTISKGK